MTVVARNVVAVALDAGEVAAELATQLGSEDLRLAFVFADWRVDPAALARELSRRLPAPVVGCTTIGVIGTVPGTSPDAAPGQAASAAGLGLYGDWVRVGVGVATDLPKSALARSRDAVHQAASALGTTAQALDPARHVAITFVDGSCGHEEAFCIGAAVAAPQIRFVGGSAATELGSSRRSFVWTAGKALADAGLVVVVESELPFEPVKSSHLLPTELKTVVTAASGRTVEELDGLPALARLEALIASLGETLDPDLPPAYSFARFVDGAPYVRSMVRFEGARIHLASAVEVGHVLRLMRPGDLIGQTRHDLAIAASRVGGQMAALLAFSCIGRHRESATRGLDHELAEVYASYPTTGFQSFGEQSGMLLVNHTLTGLAIGARR